MGWAGWADEDGDGIGEAATLSVRPTFPLLVAVTATVCETKPIIAICSVCNGSGLRDECEFELI